MASKDKDLAAVYVYVNNECCNGCGKQTAVKICDNNHKICVTCSTNTDIISSPPDQHSCAYCGYKQTMSSAVNMKLLTEALEDEEANEPVKDEFVCIDNMPLLPQERRIMLGTVMYNPRNSSVSLPLHEAEVEKVSEEKVPEKTSRGISAADAFTNASSACLDPVPMVHQEHMSRPISDEFKYLSPSFGQIQADFDSDIETAAENMDSPPPDKFWPDADSDTETEAEDMEDYMLSLANKHANASSVCLDSPLVLQQKHTSLIEDGRHESNEQQNSTSSAVQMLADTALNSASIGILPEKANSQIFGPNVSAYTSSTCSVAPIMDKKNTISNETINNHSASLPIQANQSRDSETRFRITSLKEKNNLLMMPRGFQTYPFETTGEKSPDEKNEQLPYLRFESDDPTVSKFDISAERREYFIEMRRKIYDVRRIIFNIRSNNIAVRYPVLEGTTKIIDLKLKEVIDEYSAYAITKIKHTYYPLLAFIWECEQHHKTLDPATHGSAPFQLEDYRDEIFFIGKRTLQELKDNVKLTPEASVTLAEINRLVDTVVEKLISKLSIDGKQKELEPFNFPSKKI